MAHISYRHNYYSVPAKYAGMQVRLESNGTLLKIYSGHHQIALHTITHAMGLYISQEEHKPKEKRHISRDEYYRQMSEVGNYAAEVFVQLEEKVPTHWHAMTRGILKLKKLYSNDIINRSCKRALRFNALGYQHIKRICESGLYRQDELPETTIIYTEGYGHDLTVYDNLTHYKK